MSKLKTATATKTPAAPTFPVGLLDYPFLALDVSSSAAGWASFAADALIAFGLVRPPAAHPPTARIDAIVAELAQVVCQHHPTYVIMEYSNGKVHGGAARGLSGLAILGQAQGEVRRWLVGHGLPPITVDEEWTGGRRKVSRAESLRMTCPEYAGAIDRGELKDAGLDVADAIGLGIHAIGQARLTSIYERSKKV